ncbi:MAG: hypothetical protein HXY25_11775 [Alphaproteobacteria bacterium]|nr:hypothetical protein [Alphaproteobacteria bacterium]
MSSVAWATANIFLSLFLGAIAMVAVSIWFPDVFAVILDGASWLESELGNTGLKNQYNNWVRFLIGDEQLTFMFFTVMVRVVLAIFAAGVKSAIAR